MVHLSILWSVTTLKSMKYGKLEDVTDALTMLIIYTYSSFASVYWIFNSKELFKFFMEVNKNYKHHSLIGLTYVSSVQSYKAARKMTKYWQLIGSISVIFWSLSPLILQQRVLPIQCWYPFETEGAFVYETLYFIQFLAQLAMCGAYTNGAAVYVSTIVIMLGQYDVLYCSLKNVQAHSELLAFQNAKSVREKQKRISIDEDELNQYIICKEEKVDINDFTQESNTIFKGDLKAALKYSMKCHHQFILRSCAKLEKLFNPYCLIKSLQITLQLCLLVFIAVVGDRSIVRSINVIGYVALTSIELFMFTYYGELLCLHSVRAGEALLRSPWHKNTILIKKEILIFLINSRKPVQLTAGKFFVMNVERLRSVVAQAFSFLTLLQKIAAKKP
ncbi:putative odorant receptor 85e [Episyrphus balteatus]|uniref:putative odorant receptor 85e n=1 Tax=Episyrphus balteatus TaxID=286459 RepID=UPI002486629E|nr:putative odorant receptor 85e [Episyrphus balteatus]